MKLCTKCGERKPPSDFHKHKTCPDGLRPSCKSCVNEQNRRWRLANPEKYRAAIDAWWKSHPEKAQEKRRRRLEKNPAWARECSSKNKDKINARSRAHYHANKERKAQTQARWMAENGDRVRAYSARWKRENLDKIRIYNHTRRAAKNSAVGSHSQLEIAQLLEKQEHTCANPHCGADLKMAKRHLDHMTPLSAGGSNGIENLQWLCAKCNLRKADKDQAAWMAHQETEMRRAA